MELAAEEDSIEVRREKVTVFICTSQCTDTARGPFDFCPYFLLQHTCENTLIRQQCPKSCGLCGDSTLHTTSATTTLLHDVPSDDECTNKEDCRLYISEENDNDSVEGLCLLYEEIRRDCPRMCNVCRQKDGSVNAVTSISFTFEKISFRSCQRDQQRRPQQSAFSLLFLRSPSQQIL